MKQLLSMALAVAVASQGIAWAEQPARTVEVTRVRDRATLLAHIDGMAAGDRIVVATDDGFIAGEFADKDADDVLLDRPLVEGGVERIAIPVSEIRGVQYQTSSTPRGEVIGKTIVIVALVGVGIWLWSTLVRGLGGP